MRRLLIQATRSGNLTQIQECIAAGDDIEYRDKSTGRTALLEAVITGSVKIVTWLLNKGADLNASCIASGSSHCSVAARGVGRPSSASRATRTNSDSCRRYTGADCA